MRRSQLEKAISAAQEITGEKNFVVIGSCSVLGQYPKAGEILTQFTKEIDLYPMNKPEKTEMLYVLGRESEFQDKHGFYIDAVGPNTAVLPKGWENRLIKVSNKNTNQAVGWCIDIHDLAVAKLTAHRGKDLEFVEELFRQKLADPEIIRKRMEMTNFAHHQIKNMAIDHLDQCIEDAERKQTKLQKRPNTKKINDREKDIGPEIDL